MVTAITTFQTGYKLEATLQDGHVELVGNDGISTQDLLGITEQDSINLAHNLARLNGMHVVGQKDRKLLDDLHLALFLHGVGQYTAEGLAKALRRAEREWINALRESNGEDPLPDLPIE